MVGTHDALSHTEFNSIVAVATSPPEFWFFFFSFVYWCASATLKVCVCVCVNRESCLEETRARIFGTRPTAGKGLPMFGQIGNENEQHVAEPISLSLSWLPERKKKKKKRKIAKTIELEQEKENVRANYIRTWPVRSTCVCL